MRTAKFPTFAEIAEQVHIDRLPTWKNEKHGQQWINTLRDYAFPKIGRMPVDTIGQPEVLMCLSPIWTESTKRPVAWRSGSRRCWTWPSQEASAAARTR